MFKTVYGLFILVSMPLLTAMNIEHGNGNKTNLENEIRLLLPGENHIIASKSALSYFPYIKKEIEGGGLGIRTDGSMALYIQGDYKVASYTFFLQDIVQELGKFNNLNEMEKKIDFNAKANITKLVEEKKLTLMNLVECIKICDDLFLKKPSSLCQFLCSELVFNIAKRLKDDVTQVHELAMVHFDRSILKNFNFLQQQCTNIFSSRLEMMSLHSSVVLNIPFPEPMYTAAMVQPGMLYAYIVRHKNKDGGTVYLVDFHTKTVRESMQQHGEQEAYYFFTDTLLMPALHKNVIASIMTGDNKVLFHTADNTQYQAINLINDVNIKSTCYAFSGDAKYFLVAYNNGESFLHLYNVEGTEETENIKLNEKEPVKGILFNPADTASIFYFTEHNCKIMSTQNPTRTYSLPLDEHDFDNILNAQFSINGDYIYLLALKNNNVVCYRWHYLFDKMSINLTDLIFNSDVKTKLLTPSNHDLLMCELENSMHQKTLLEFNFIQLKPTVLVKEQHESLDSVTTKNILAYRSFKNEKQMLAWYDCFFHKKIIDLGIPEKFRGIIGFSSENELLVRKQDNIVAYKVYNDCATTLRNALDNTVFDFNTYISFLKLLVQEKNVDWHIDYLILLPLDIRRQVESCITLSKQDWLKLALRMQYLTEKESESFEEHTKKEAQTIGVSKEAQPRINPQQLTPQQILQARQQIQPVVQGTTIPQPQITQHRAQRPVPPATQPQPPAPSMAQRVITGFINLGSTIGNAFIYAITTPLRLMRSWLWGV